MICKLSLYLTGNPLVSTHVLCESILEHGYKKPSLIAVGLNCACSFFRYALHVGAPFVYDLEASLPVTQLPVHYVDPKNFVVIQDIDWNVFRTAEQNDSKDLNHGEKISNVWESAIPSKDIEASYWGKECKFILLINVLMSIIYVRSTWK